jgi:hypothetical protein
VIGENAIEGLRNWFCVNQLEPYRELFAPGKPEASFENTKRRFAWFKRTLKEATQGSEGGAINGGIFNIFPDVWQMTQLFASEFCRMTREHIDTTLSSGYQTIDIALIISTM